MAAPNHTTADCIVYICMWIVHKTNPKTLTGYIAGAQTLPTSAERQGKGKGNGKERGGNGNGKESDNIGFCGRFSKITKMP